MRKIVTCVVLALALAGCNANPDVATPNQAYIGLNAYVAAGRTATIYLRSPACTVRPPAALCQTVYTAIKSVRVARKQINAALMAHQDVPITALQTLQAAYSVIQSIPQN